MRPVHIGHLRASEFFGGPERAILGQAANMPDYKFTFISFVRQGETNRFLNEVKSIDLDTARLSEIAAGDIRLIPQLRKLVCEKEIDLLVSHDYKSRVVGHFALRSGSTAHIGHFRGVTLEDPKVRVYNWIDRKVMRRMKKILTVSRKSASLLERWGVLPSAIEVIPNAIAAHKLLPESFRREVPAGRLIRIVAAGRLSHEKGYDILLDAISLLVTNGNSNFHVTIYGQGPEETALKKQTGQKRISEYVSFVGFVDDILPILKAADLLVLPSRTEGMPNIILEAWSQKIAVLSTAAGGVPEMISNNSNGWLAEAENSQSLATALANAISNPESIANLGQAGYNTIKERYLFPRQAQLLDKVYRSVVNRPDAVEND